MTFYTNSCPEPPHERIGEINGRCPRQPAPTLCLDSAEAGYGNSQSAPAAMHGEMSRGAKFRNHRFPSQKEATILLTFCDRLVAARSGGKCSARKNLWSRTRTIAEVLPRLVQFTALHGATSGS